MSIINDMLKSIRKPNPSKHTYLENVVGGSFYRMSDMKSGSDLTDIRSLIRTMRALAEDSQVATALSYYATDATSPNSSGYIIWATSNSNAKDDKSKEVAELVNTLFRRWKVNSYARDHILELATVGNLYIPTTEMKRNVAGNSSRMYVGLDQNDIPHNDYDIIPSHTLDPTNVVHVWSDYEPLGYLYTPEDDVELNGSSIVLPESSIIHFSLGGVIGKYSLQGKNAQGDDVTYDIQFADPLLKSATGPTQTLNLLEDSTVLSSLIKIVRFISIDCQGADEEEIMPTLQRFKNIIEQQISLNTNTGDAQSYLNPQSPNNIVYLPKINGNSPIEISDLNLADNAEATDKLLEYFQDKKLSVLGIPKEALNFSSSEGLGGAGAVMSQRSALYANALQRIETAYINGWTAALNEYFKQRNLPQYVDAFTLHMNPILTELSTVQFEKRDSAISQASAIVDLLKDLNNTNVEDARTAITEILTEALPDTGSKVNKWDIDLTEPSEEM